jgi:hypothetical protein
MKTKSKVILLLSDLHIGSTVGLWPEGFICNEGFPIGQNKFQEWLWACWQDMLGWAKTTIGKDDFELVLNGDLVEGIHHRTLQVMSADVSDQTTAVLDVLGLLSARASRVHVVKGTECHTRNDEIRIGSALNGTRDPQTGQHAWDRLDLDVNGCLVSFAHHIGTTSRPYLEAAQHSINLGVEIHEAARMGRPIPKVICRAHRHRHGVWSDGNSMSIVTGAWQGITRFGRKVVPAAIPQPSAVILDWRSVEKGELPIVHPRVYTAK